MRLLGRQLHRGDVLTVRRRLGPTRLIVTRLVGWHRGRLFIIGHDPRTGVCHRVWASRVSRIGPRL